MKKERNAFFQNNSSSSYFYPTAPMMNQFGLPMATESNSNFYQGPVAPIIQGMSGNDYNSELESRLAKIERQINRLDTRVTKLESEIIQNGSGNEYTTNNMYMV